MTKPRKKPQTWPSVYNYYIKALTNITDRMVSSEKTRIRVENK
jgi:hypothetical protein